MGIAVWQCRCGVGKCVLRKAFARLWVWVKYVCPFWDTSHLRPQFPLLTFPVSHGGVYRGPASSDRLCTCLAPESSQETGQGKGTCGVYPRGGSHAWVGLTWGMAPTGSCWISCCPLSSNPPALLMKTLGCDSIAQTHCVHTQPYFLALFLFWFLKRSWLYSRLFGGSKFLLPNWHPADNLDHWWRGILPRADDTVLLAWGYQCHVNLHPVS